MIRKRPFVLIYACSGLAGLIYQVTWTRLLTLYMGHTVAAVTTVVAAFMGGLAVGALIGGRIAQRLPRRNALYAYGAVEAIAAVTAVALPFALRGLEPIVSAAYADGAAPVLFPLTRALLCVAVLLIPTAALGASFPLAVRWYVHPSIDLGRGAGTLYAVNTVGAAVGALAAGFVLLPALGNSGTLLVAIAISIVAVAAALMLARRSSDDGRDELPAVATLKQRQQSGRRERTTRQRSAASPVMTRAGSVTAYIAAFVLLVTGFSTLMYEIAWTRVLSLLAGPTTYSVAATLAMIIAGIAAGSLLGTLIAARTRVPHLWIAVTLAVAALAVAWTTSFVGSSVPKLIAEQLARSTSVSLHVTTSNVLTIALLILPAAATVGISFPLALSVAPTTERTAAARVGVLYAVNTVASVAGTVATGYAAIPMLGVEGTLKLVSVLLLAAALVVMAVGAMPPWGRIATLTGTVGSLAILIWGPSWDRPLLASGVYKYAAFVRSQVDPEAALTAGDLLYYRDGAASTVSVKRLTGALSLSIDGKVDASTGSDMVTQKLLAHLPLLLHANPRQVLIIGVGSGVTAGAALTHPIERADVVEISPEVVEASDLFASWNGHFRADPRVRLIVGDGRSHVQLAKQQYDVLISEPSNPWIAGVAALFTRDFFLKAKDRLAPGGIICQWTHTYDISERDFQSIVATFVSVFPNSTMWMVGRSDVLLIASAATGPLALDNLERASQIGNVRVDLESVGAAEPFALWSLYASGSDALHRYVSGAPLQSDTRMSLEFSGPLALNSGDANQVVGTLLTLARADQRPAIIRDAYARAGAPEWRNRAAMMARIEDQGSAYDAYRQALALDPDDEATVNGLIRSAVATERGAAALALLDSIAETHPLSVAVRVAQSKLLASMQKPQQAASMAADAYTATRDPAALEQLASIYSDVGDASALAATASKLEQLRPEAAQTAYYSAASRFALGDAQGALVWAQRAVERDRENAASHNLLGAIHATLAARDEAKAAFQTALRLNPRDAVTYINLGVLALESGDRQAARRFFAEALVLNPQSPVARKGLSESRPRDR